MFIVIFITAKDQPEAATQLFNNDPELVKANNGQQVKFLNSEGDWNVLGSGKKISAKGYCLRVRSKSA